MEITGTSGNDTLNGTELNDAFDLTQGGNDHVFGLGSNDTFTFGATLTRQDKIDGGTGEDAILLNGDYTGVNAVNFVADSLVSVESMVLAAGHSYDLKIVDANTSGTFTVYALDLAPGNFLDFDGSADTDTAITITGGTGNDILRGGGGSDVFALYGGGSDSAYGGAGGEFFNMADTFDTTDVLNGGSDSDFMVLNGDYSAGMVVTKTMMKSIEIMTFQGAFDYDLTLQRGVIDGDLSINASPISGGHGVTFSIRAELVGTLNFTATAGNDTIIGGHAADMFNLSQGGIDIAKGGDGDDAFTLGATLTAADRIQGGDGTDTLNLTGNYSAGLTFGGATMTGIETIVLGSPFSYSLTTANANVAAGEALTVTAIALTLSQTLTFDGSHETDGSFVITGAGGNDTITGGDQNDTIGGGIDGADTINGRGGNDALDGNPGNDTLDGGSGDDGLIGSIGQDHLLGASGIDTLNGGSDSDVLEGGAGNDIFVYAVVQDSATGGTRDTIIGFNAEQDSFDLLNPVTGIDAAITTGALSAATFDANLSAAVNAGNLAVNHAVLFTASSGDLAGKTFLIVDRNVSGGYQSNVDIVIQLDSALHLDELSLGNFI